MKTPEQCIKDLDTALRTDRKRTAGLDATYQFVIAGANGGSWFVEARSGTGRAEAGTVTDPTVTVHTSEDVFVKLATGELGGQDAFFSGKLRVEGEQPMAMYLKQIFGT